MKRLLTRSLLTSIAATSVLLGLVVAPALSAKSTTDKVTSGSWGQGLAVVDPTVPANDVTPSDYAAIDLKITLTGTTLSWDNGPGNVIGGCGAPEPGDPCPGCLPYEMTLGVYKFPYVAGTGSPVAEVGGHFVLNGVDARGSERFITLTTQSDTGFAHLPTWALPSDQVTTGSWGRGVAVVDTTVPANDVTPSDYAAVDLAITLTAPTLSWDNGPKAVIGGCGAPEPGDPGPGCLPYEMTPGVYTFPYVAGTGGVVANIGGHFNLSGTGPNGKSVFISLTIQSDTGFANLPSWAIP